jgi:hypothetical protein
MRLVGWAGAGLFVAPTAIAAHVCEQYKVEEILEMGIDGFWIGYEGTRSGYAKQQGRPVEDILTEFRQHGISVLTSMILGFDYQTPEVVAQELDGLLKLKPALGQYLIYGPVPGTPFNERVRRDNLMLEQFVKEPAKLYRRADGFTTTMKHPTLSPTDLEDLQRQCFEQDFQRLGPSIFRFLEARFLGYQKLKDSANPALRAKAAHYAHELRNAYPIFLAGRLFGPNKQIRQWIADFQQRLHAELGRPTLAEHAKTVAALGGLAWTKFTIAADLFQHPSLKRTAYRLPSKRWQEFHLWEQIPQKVAAPELSVQVQLHHARQQVWLRLEGALSKHHVEDLAHRIQDTLARTKSKLVLDLDKLHWDKIEDLKPLRERLAAYRGQIRLVLPKLAAAHPEVVLLAAMFQHYKG